jgi:hypothetical protein
VVFGDDIIDLIEGYVYGAEDAIREDIGSCRQMYDAAQGVVYGGCVYFLESFNAFWYCYGWFLFFAVPSLIFAAILAGLYREWSDNSVAHFDVQVAYEPPPAYTEGDPNAAMGVVLAAAAEPKDEKSAEKSEKPKSNQVAPLEEMTSDVDAGTSQPAEKVVPEPDQAFNPNSFEVSEKGGLDGWWFD